MIDDDESSRESIKALLDPMRAQVKTFESAEAFLAEYKEERPACLVVDQRMPGMGGIQLLELLRHRNCFVSFVLMTAYPNTRSTVRAIQGGAIDLLEKPCDPEELWERIQLGLKLDLQRCKREAERLEAVRRFESLSESEREVARLLCDGHANKVIAAKLELGLRTIEARRASIMRKFQVDSVAAMLRVWLRAHDEY